jgi:stage IV sporulation protein B
VQQKWLKRCLGLVFVLLLTVVSLSPTWQDFLAFPNKIRMVNGELLTKPSHIPVAYDTDVTGTPYATLNIGKIPIKRAKVQVVSPKKVIPGGQSIGIKLKSKGIMVVGYNLVYTSSGKVSPAEKAGIQIGDTILSINGKPATSVKMIGLMAEEAGKANKNLHFTIVRENRQYKINLKPLMDQKEQTHRMGMYVRDSAAGVGTLTFLEPTEHKYGALGHVISDVDTGQPIVVGQGKVLRSHVTSIQKGESGEPGEKRAIFTDEDQIIGNIVRNTAFGIFGKMKELPNKGLYNTPIPVGLQEEVKEGPARILTVLNGQKVESFQIQIVSVNKQRFPSTKGLILKVTDPRLLSLTGGIVQGMSGSPIIQNGKIIGAVTHVFVNDPSAGYGTFIEWMLKDADVQTIADTLKGAAFFILDKDAVTYQVK